MCDEESSSGWNSSSCETMSCCSAVGWRASRHRSSYSPPTVHRVSEITQSIPELLRCIYFVLFLASDVGFPESGSETLYFYYFAPLPNVFKGKNIGFTYKKFPFLLKTTVNYCIYFRPGYGLYVNFAQNIPNMI